MPSMYRTLGLSLLIGVLVISGFGCKKRTVQPYQSNRYGTVVQNPPASDESRTTSEPTDANRFSTQPEQSDDYIPPEIIYLRQVLRNFTNADSFRASITMPTPQGKIAGDIEFSRKKGLHGVLRLPTNQTTEVYLIDQNVFFRSNTSTWLNLFGTPEGSQVSHQFSTAFSLNANASSTFISDSARIIDIKDQPSGCKLYNFTQYTSAATKETMHICVKDNLPTFMSVDTRDGGVDVYYRDYNTAIDIVSPVK